MEDGCRLAVDVILLVCEPLRHRGAYDFGSSDLPARTRDLGFDLAAPHGGGRAVGGRRRLRRRHLFAVGRRRNFECRFEHRFRKLGDPQQRCGYRGIRRNGERDQ